MHRCRAHWPCRRTRWRPSRRALLTDFDGTLSPIVRDPFMAGLVDGADGALEALAERLAVVAIVTGRMPLDARRLVGVPGVLVVGNHGTEWLDPDQSEPTTAPGAEAVGHALDEALARVPPMPGVMADHKGVSASDPLPPGARSGGGAIGHPRGPGRPRAARPADRARADDRRDPSAGARRQGHGRPRDRRALRPPRRAGHGRRHHRPRHVRPRSPSCEPTGRLRAAIVAVGGTDHDVLPEVAAAADVVLDTPAEAAELLARLSE